MACGLPPGAKLRPYDTGDAVAASRLHGEVFPISPASLDRQLRLPSPALVEVVTAGTALVGLLEVRLRTPQRCGLRLVVAPRRRGRGIGTALLERARSYAARVMPSGGLLRAAVRDDDEGSLCWAKRHEFGQVAHSVTLSRSLTESAPELERAAEAAAQRAGVQVRPWTDAPSDADWAVLAELMQRCTQGSLDTSAARITPDVARYLAPHPRGVLIAAAAGRPVGVTSIAPEGPAFWYAWFTGVVPAARAAGVGSALKLATLALARREGADRVDTNNDVKNAPILAVNERLGFVRSGGIVWLHAPVESGGLGGER